MRERFTVSPRTYALVAQTAMLILVLIVFSGAAVRTSGSGLGCPDWPDCRGTFLPAFEKHTWMEYSNRLLSSVVGVVCVAAGLLAFQRRPFRRDILRPALVLPVGVILEGGLGAAAVAFDLQWPVVIAHYLLSLVLLVAATIVVWRLRRDEDAPPPRHDRIAVLGTRALTLYGGLIIVLGTFATAAGPHAGGAGTGDVVRRLDVFGAGTLVKLIKIHGHLAAALGFFALALFAYLVWRGVRGELRRTLAAVCVLLGVQGALGLWQYHTQLPAELVWIHSSLPAVLWALLVWSWLAAGRPAGEPPPDPASPDRADRAVAAA
jgi:cytochrome c oxidase assembly protein subunit 15